MLNNVVDTLSIILGLLIIIYGANIENYFIARVILFSVGVFIIRIPICNKGEL